ncbi:MAG: citrate/2-methylcitrate synthase [Pseudomonadota bacterium]
MEAIDLGLEGVVIGETAIANVDGSAGELSYRGVGIEELVNWPFLSVVWLLLFGEEPSVREEHALAHFLMAHRDLSASEQSILDALPVQTHPMLMLQALVPLLDLKTDADLAIPFGGPTALEGLVIAARIPTLIASWRRKKLGLAWPLKSRSLDPLAAFLECLDASEPDSLALATLARTQILQLEHSYNAGTFAGRVALGARAPLQSSISASIGTLFGTLHGGADEAALAFAKEVADPKAADLAVADVLHSGGRVMGIGHREYQTLDPRAKLLKPMAQELCAQSEEAAFLFETLVAIEKSCRQRLAKPGRELHANVEFYKGAVFHALGLPGDFFTAMFAMARVYGYLAHALEFEPNARLIRPRARYIGK